LIGRKKEKNESLFLIYFSLFVVGDTNRQTANDRSTSYSQDRSFYYR